MCPLQSLQLHPQCAMARNRLVHLKGMSTDEGKDVQGLLLQSFFYLG